MPKSPTPPPDPIAVKLDEMLDLLRKMNKRDRMRTWGGFARGLVGLIPIAVLLGSVWYAFEYGDELLRKITEQAAEQAAIMTNLQSGDALEEFRNLFNPQRASGQ